MDLVFPNNNEEKLVVMAKLLGVRELMLCYPLADRDIQLRQREVKKLSGKVVTRFGVLVDRQADVQKALRLTNDIVARGVPWVYDDKRVRFVMDMEAGKRRDFTHHRNSGLNQVFIKKAMASGKTFLVNASLLYGDNATVLGRMIQNNTFFRKYKPDVLVVSGASTPLGMRNPRDLQALLRL